MQKTEIYLADEAATLQYGEKLAKACADSCIIFLQGELGAGKTTLARGFLRGFGYQGVVKSPTYTLVESYEISGKSIFHFDLYRLKSPEELLTIGIEDYFGHSAIFLIEWPQRAVSFLPEADLEIEIQIAAQGRKLLLTAATKKGAAMIEKTL